MTTNRNLTCCVCSDPAGRWAQHWNRDTGWGICTRCAAEQSGKETPERMAELYGLPGVNYEQPTIKVAGRVFNVMAMFRNNPTGTAKANAYLAHQDDTGRPA